MAKQIIDIGVQGNDGTGDSIRDSFRKVNENFNEIYSIFGQGRITLSQLGDGTLYSGNQLIMGNATGSSLVARTIVPGSNIDINISDVVNPETLEETHTVTFSSRAARISDDISPEIKFPFNANFQPIGCLPEPSQTLVDSFNRLWDTQTQLDELPVTVGYANKNYVRLSTTGTVAGPITVRSEPSIPDTTNPAYDPTLTGNYLANEVLPRKDVIYRGGDTITGALYLSSHPSDLSQIIGATNKSDLQAATAYYVDNKTFTSSVNLYVATSGDDLQTRTPTGKEGRFWNYAFSSFRGALTHAESLISIASQEPGPYKQRISWTRGADQTFSTVKKVTLTDGNTATPQYVSAFNLLQANREFIQAETIAYINKKYVNPFLYDRTVLSSKISSLITSVGNDILLGSTSPNSSISGTNYNSYWEGVSYLHDNLTNEGLIQWVETIKFVREQIVNFSYDPDALEVYTVQIIEALAYDAIFKTNYLSIQAGIAFNNANTKLSSTEFSSMLAINPISILTAKCENSIVTLTFAAQSTVTFPKGSRIQINATFTSKTIATDPITLTSYSNDTLVTYEVISGTTTSVTFNKGTTGLVNDSFTVVGTIDRNNLINILLLTPTVKNSPIATASIVSNAAVISNCITNNILPAVSFVEPLGRTVQFTDSSDLVILNNHGYVNGDVVSFSEINLTTGISINSTYYVVNRTTNNFRLSNSLSGSVIQLSTNGTGRLIRMRAAGYAAARKLLLENIDFIQAETLAFLSSDYSTMVYDKPLCVRDVKYVIWSLIYDLTYGGNSQSVYAGKNFLNLIETDACVALLRNIKTLALSIIANDIVPTSRQQSVRQHRNDTMIDGEVANLSMVTNIEIIVSIITDINNVPAIVYPSILTSPVILQPVYTAIHDSLSVYTTGSTTSTSWFMNRFYPVINDEIDQQKIKNLFQIVIDIIESGQVPTELPTYPSLSFNVNNNITTAMINQARGILTYSVIDSIATNTSDYAVLTYGTGSAENITIDELVLKQEIRNIVVAICYDITFGGTSATFRAGKQFTLIGNNIISESIINIASTETRSHITGYITGDTSLNHVSALINEKFNVVNGILNSSITAATEVNLNLYVSGKYESSLVLRGTILNNITAISNSTYTYTADKFAGGFQYDETLCFRDIGFIIDSLSIDLIAGSAYTYISNKFAGGFLNAETLDALQFATNLGLQVLTGTEFVRYQLIPQTFSFLTIASCPSASIGVAGTTASTIVDTDSVYDEFAAGMQSIINVLNFGVSAAPAPTHGSGVWHIAIDNGGTSNVDQGAPANNDIFPAKILVGVGTADITASNAYGSIVKYIPNEDTSGAGVLANVDTIQVRLTKPGFFKIGEYLEFGETVRDLNITVFVESGIYYEDYPIRIPPNVSIRGDEMRRTIIRPKDRISQSPWRKIFFYRDAVVDGLETGIVNYSGVDYAPVDITATLDGVTNKIVVSLGDNYQSLVSWIGKVFVDMNIGGNLNDDEFSASTSAHATINAGTGTTTGSVISTNVSGTIAEGDYVIGNGIPNGSIITSVSSNTVNGVTTLSFDIEFPLTNSTTLAAYSTTLTTTALLKFCKQSVGNKKRGKAVVDSVSGNTFNCTVIYPFDTSGLYDVGQWKLCSTINYGRHYLTNPLDETSESKNNKDIDVFLCNEGNRIIGMTFQGHGGFTMVLDPEGNIKTKSPYILECSSFTQSNNYRRFAGGQYIDGFAGRLYGTITAIADQGITVTVVGELNSGLDVRPPQPPCSFYVHGKRYQIDDVISFNSVTKTVVLRLDKSTTYLYDPITYELSYNEAKAQRDVRYVIDAVVTDQILGTNYRSVHAGRAFIRPYSSALYGTLQDLTIAGINKANDIITSDTYFGANSTITSNFSIITNMLLNGVNATPEITWPTSSTADKNKVRDIIQNNKEFIKTEISAYLASSLSGIVISSYSRYNVLTTERDISYIVDSITYDVFFGGSSQTYDSAFSLYNNGVSVIQGQTDLYKIAYEHLKSILASIVVGTLISKSAGNSLTQNISNIPGTDYSTTVSSLCDILIDYVLDSTFTPTVANPCIVVSALVSGAQTGTYTVGNLLTVSGVTGVIAYVSAVSAGMVTAVNFIGTGATVGNFTSTPSSLVELSTTVNTGTGAGAKLTLVVGPQTFPTIANSAYTSLMEYPVISLIASTVTNFLNNGANQKINIEAGGNRSMLANNFSMFNDLAYGIVATNGAFTEQVCTFTYYAHTGFWANNGSNLRGVGCSNTFGNYGIRASGYDVTEFPDSVNIVNHMIQTVRVYKQGNIANEMEPTSTTPAVAVWIIGYDYLPTNGAALEIDHTIAGGIITRYVISSIEYTAIQISGQVVLKLNLNSSGVSAGLAHSLYHGQVLKIWSLKNVKFSNVDNVKPTRPSTALQYNDNLSDVYRIVAYNLSESTGDMLDNNVAVLQSDNSFSYYNFPIDPVSIVNGDPDSNIVATIVSGSIDSKTVTVNNLEAGTSIEAGHIITGVGFAGHIVETVSGSSTYTITLSEYPSTTPYGTVSFSFATQGSKVGDTKLAISQLTQLPIINQINKGTYVTAWNGRLHRILSYVQPNLTATRTFAEYNDPTLVVYGSSGIIADGSLILGKNSTTGVIEFTGTVVSSVYYQESSSTNIVVSNATGTPSNGSIITFGVISNGYLEISPNAIINNSADGSAAPAMVQVGTIETLDWSLFARLVTFDIPYNRDNLLPKVDSYLTIENNSNSSYNGSYQITSVLDQTVLSVGSTAAYAIGMIVTFQIFIISVSGGKTFTTSAIHNLSVGDVIIPVVSTNDSTYTNLVAGTSYYIKTATVDGNSDLKCFTLAASSGGAELTNFKNVIVGSIEITTPLSRASHMPTSGVIIQSVDVGQIVVSPSCWAQHGTPIRATLAATVLRIDIIDGGSGYTAAPVITITGGGATQNATATCVISNGVITEVKMVLHGYGYTSQPLISVNQVFGTPAPAVAATLSVVLSQEVIKDSTSTSGVTTSQLTMVYPADPGVFGTNTSKNISAASAPTAILVNGITIGYYVDLTFASLTTPVVGEWYRILGNLEGATETLYNGFVQVIAGGTLNSTHARVSYPYDPGTWGTSGTATITKTNTAGSSNTLGISKPFDTESSYTLVVGYAANTGAQVTTRISTCRATGHDFCDIGTGGYSTTNIPYSIYGEPALSRQVSHETLDEGVGRCFYVSTNQDGIFRVGRFFSVDQGTGTVTLSSSLALSNVEAFGFSGRGAVVNEFSTDSTLTDNSSNKVPVESAVRGYIDKRLGLDHGGSQIPFTSIIGPGFLPLNGIQAMTGDISMGGHTVAGLRLPTSTSEAASKGYVDTLIDAHNSLVELADVSITVSSLSSAQLLTYDTVTSMWLNKSLTGDITLTYSGGVLSAAIGFNKIVNSMISTTAGIAQSKLSLSAASTRANATGITQVDLGVSSYNSLQFTSTNGWVELVTASSETTGVTLGKIQQIASGNILGNRSGSTGAVSLITPSQVVTDGDGVKNVSFASTGVMVVTAITSGKASGYSVIGYTTTGENSKIVQTGASGEIDVKQLKVDSYKIVDTVPTGLNTPATTKVVLTTPGNFDFLSSSGDSSSNAVTSVAGTLDVSGTNNSIKVTAITTGSDIIEGTLVGAWTVPATSSLTIAGGINASGEGLTASETRPTIRPSVIFDFANSKTLDPRIAFNRNSIGTYYNDAGILKTALANQPRFDYNPTTGIINGLLLEEQRKNWLTFSASFATSGGSQNWTDTNITRTVASGVTAPDATTAIKFAASAANATVAISGSVAAGPIYRTFSIWLQRVTGTGVVSITMNNGNDWTTVTITTTLTRYTFTNSTSDNRVAIKIASSGDSIIMWGAQLEEGSFATSYIPTTTAEVTRYADDVYVDGTNFSRWYRQDQGTFIISHAATAIDATVRDYGGVTVENSDSSSMLSVRCSSSGTGSLIYDAFGSASSVTQFNFVGLTTTETSLVTHAVAYIANSCAHSYNGTVTELEPVGQTSATMASNMVRLHIGNNVGAQTVARIVYYPKRLSDAELKSTTTQ